MLEAQIVENLQRADIHPIDEGSAYRHLIEKSKLATADIAICVGKSDTYVKQRLFLTNLDEKSAAAYRAGKMLDGHAVLIAKLSGGDQLKAVKHLFDAHHLESVKDLKEWIEEHIYDTLENQPWLKDKAALEAVGKCQECEPNRASLFGNVKEGACTDLKCWGRKMDKYIAWRVKEGKLTKVSNDYGRAPAGIIGRSNYVLVAKKGKDRCKHVAPAIIVLGSELGKEIDICVYAKCGMHRGMKSQYGMTPAEQEKRKAERKKEIAEEKAEKIKTSKDMDDLLAHFTSPILTGKQLGVVFEMAVYARGNSILMPIVARRGLEIKKISKHGYDMRDYEGALIEAGKTDAEKIQIIVEILMGNIFEEKRKAILKKF